MAERRYVDPRTGEVIDKTGNASRRDPNQPMIPSLDDRRRGTDQEAN